MKKPTKREAARLAKRYSKLPANGHVLRAIDRLHARADLIAGMPMKTVLAKLPAETPSARAKLLGVSRQTLYDWLAEKSRPNLQQAEKLATLTGLSIKEIRARE